MSIHDVGATEGRAELEAGRPVSLRPAGLAHVRVGPKQVLPTPREDHRRPHKGGGHVATSLGRPPLRRPASPTFAAIEAGSWHGSYVHRLQLLTTDAKN